MRTKGCYPRGPSARLPVRPRVARTGADHTGITPATGSQDDIHRIAIDLSVRLARLREMEMPPKERAGGP